MTRWLGSAYDWIDERAAIRNLLRKGLYEAVPVRGSWFYTLGSATLVLQTVLLPLLTAKGISTLTLEGGTHNPFAPPFVRCSLRRRANGLRRVRRGSATT